MQTAVCRGPDKPRQDVSEAVATGWDRRSEARAARGHRHNRRVTRDRRLSRSWTTVLPPRAARPTKQNRRPWGRLFWSEIGGGSLSAFSAARQILDARPGYSDIGELAIIEAFQLADSLAIGVVTLPRALDRSSKTQDRHVMDFPDRRLPVRSAGRLPFASADDVQISGNSGGYQTHPPNSDMRLMHDSEI